MLELETGMLTGGLHSVGDWENVRDASIAAHLPELLDHQDLTPPDQFAQEMVQAAQALNYRKTIEAIESASDSQLEQFRNEVQFLLEVFLTPERRAGALIDTHDFVTFFKARHMTPGGSKQFAEFVRSLGIKQIPGSPMQRWYAFHQHRYTNHSSQS